MCKCAPLLGPVWLDLCTLSRRKTEGMLSGLCLHSSPSVSSQLCTQHSALRELSRRLPGNAKGLGGSDLPLSGID